MRNRSENTTGALANLAVRRVDAARVRRADALAKVERYHDLTIELPRTDVPARKMILALDRVSHRFPGADRPLIDAFELTMLGPERVALAGPNGSGKTTLLKLVTGDLVPSGGEVRLGAERVAYLVQHVRLLDPVRTVLDNFKRLNPGLRETDCRLSLARFLFRSDAALKPAGHLSGGEKLRAALACILMAELPPQLIILDEPTNHLDLDSIEAVESALTGYGGAMIVVSHDVTFLANIGVSRTVSLRPLDHDDVIASRGR